MASFKEFTPSKTISFLKRLDKHNVPHSFNPKATKVLGQNISFADGWMRIDCEDFSEMPHQKSIYLANDMTIIPLSYTPTPLDNVFKTMPVAVNDNNVIDYLSLYFLAFVQNGERLKPVFHTDDIQWQDDLSPMLRKSLELDFSKYPRIQNINNNYMVELLCVFRQSIMAISCEVHADGHVDVVDRIVITDDLPIQ
jgi:hypothetical protein